MDESFKDLANLVIDCLKVCIANESRIYPRNYEEDKLCDFLNAHGYIEYNKDKGCFIVL
jgi:hypothetical protein